METDKNLFDTSDYPKEHPLHSNANKKVLGKMKDECAGTPIAECVCLRPKMYSIMKADEKNIKKAKGVKKSAVKKRINHEQYVEVLLGAKQLWHGAKILRSEGHEIWSVYQNKVSLSPFESKRWIADDGILTKAYGHKSLRAEWPTFVEEEQREIEAEISQLRGYENVDILPTFTDDEIIEMEAEASHLRGYENVDILPTFTDEEIGEIEAELSQFLRG
jgi:hypothetical protein